MYFGAGFNFDNITIFMCEITSSKIIIKYHTQSCIGGEGSEASTLTLSSIKV